MFDKVVLETEKHHHKLQRFQSYFEVSKCRIDIQVTCICLMHVEVLVPNFEKFSIQLI